MTTFEQKVKELQGKVNWPKLLFLGALTLVFAVAALLNVTKGLFFEALIMAVIGAVFVILLKDALPGKKYESFCKQVDKLGDRQAILAHVDALEPCTAAAGADLRFDDKYIAYVGKNAAGIRLAGDLVWGHLMNTEGQRHVLGVIPAGKVVTHSAYLRFADKSILAVDLPDTDTVSEVLECLKARYPYMMVGYNAQLEAYFAQDPRQLWAAAGYQNEKAKETDVAD